jgi:hypothetical protein
VKKEGEDRVPPHVKKIWHLLRSMAAPTMSPYENSGP